jgi:hypothetical protein
MSEGRALGRAARWSNIPSVKAYRGPLPVGAEGIEFTTTVAPSPGDHPALVFWHKGTEGVLLSYEEGQEFAMIPVRVTRFVYR